MVYFCSFTITNYKAPTQINNFLQTHMEFFNSLPLSQYSKEPYLALRILAHSISSLTAIIQLIFANNAEMISLKVEGNSLRLWLDLIIVTRQVFWNQTFDKSLFTMPLLTFLGAKSSPHLAKFMACPDHWQYFWTHC